VLRKKRSESLKNAVVDDAIIDPTQWLRHRWAWPIHMHQEETPPFVKHVL